MKLIDRNETYRIGVLVLGCLVMPFMLSMARMGFADTTRPISSLTRSADTLAITPEPRNRV